MDSAAPNGCHRRNIPETKKGIGPCDIRYEVKLRSGKPNYWCFTHGMEAAAPDGSAVERCEASWFDPVPADMRAEFDVSEEAVAIWGDFRPPVRLGNVPRLGGKVHVHVRPAGSTTKSVDQSFDIVTLRNGDREVTIEGMAAVAYSTAVLAGQPMKALACRRCGELHIDEAMFATKPHKKHLCNSCGRNFNDLSGASVANPLADLAKRLGVDDAAADPVEPDRPLHLDPGEYSGIALWPSNLAIISTARRAEEHGIHVHAWDLEGDLNVDETFSSVTIGDHAIDRSLLVLLALQQASDPEALFQSCPCAACASPLADWPSGDWLKASTRHECQSCGTETKTRRKVMLNPLASLCRAVQLGEEPEPRA